MALTKKNEKLGQRGSLRRHVTYFGIFGPLHISGTVEARNFKFGMQMDPVSYYKGKNEKIGQRDREGVT